MPLIFAHLALASSSALAPLVCGSFPMQLDTVARGVYVAYVPEQSMSMFYPNGNSTIIVNDHDAIVVDTGTNPAVGECLVRLVRRLTPNPVRYVVNTHWHPDHTLGNQAFTKAFPGLEIIASSRTRAGMLDDLAKVVSTMVASTASRQETGRQMIADITAHPVTGNDRVLAAFHQYFDHELDQRQRDYTAARVTPPTMIVDSELVIERGSREIRIVSIGKGDAPGTLAVYLPRDSVIMTGDLVVAPVPFGFTGEPIAWRATLARIDSLPVRVIVPGHGAPEHDRRYLHQLMALVDTVTARARTGLAAGVSPDSVLAHIDDTKLGDAFTYTDPVKHYFFDLYFLAPYVGGVTNALKPEAAKP